MAIRKKYLYECTVLKVVDGDTMDLTIDLGFKIYREDRFRLARINAPELRTEEGKQLKTLLAEKYTGATVFVETHKSDIYGRYIAEIWTEEECIHNLSDWLLEQKLAVPYTGGKTPR